MARDLNTTDLFLGSASKPVKNIVLVGRTGNGKSSTGNSLLGRKAFLARSQASGVTSKSQMFSAVTACGSYINVIDTPAMSDLSVPADIARKEIVNCLTMAEEGIHAVLFVLSTRGRITHEEESTLNTLQVLFGSKIIDYIIVLFTGGDELEADKMTLNQYLSSGCSDPLKIILRMCHRRMVMFDNKTMDEVKKARQVRNLMDHVETIKNNNNGNPYTAEMHRQIKEDADRRRVDQDELEANKSTIEKKQKRYAAVLEKMKSFNDI